MKIYGTSNSRSTRVLWVAEEAGIAYDYESVDLKSGAARSEPYLSINPAGKVPALVDGELVLTESAAICNYLAHCAPQSGLLPPEGTKERALVDRWSYFAMTEMDAPLWVMTKHTFIYPEDMRVPAIVTVAMGEFARAVGVLDKGLGEREFIVGDRFTVADVLLGHCLSWAKAFQVPIESERVMSYAKQLWSRPALARARERETVK
ncbi:glutathione S-transferase [Chitinivorax tropicus]|uniref:Glutathione S-transferase n=1 Tax=Chitinivorax tropicus TaxID=714531 RepID=A0A840MKR0_9PROT|nr:glutathione S-transferase [Chitinivorax tropicus]